MSSMFDNTKIVGGAFFVVGILQIVAAILVIIAGFGDPATIDGEPVEHWKEICIVSGIGSLICACLYFFFAVKVYNGTISQKINILASYVRIVGVITIIAGIFDAIAVFVAGGGLGGALVTAIITIIIGLIIMFIAGKIVDGKQTVGDKIIWIILLVVFVLKLIVEALGIFGSFNPLSISGIVSGIAGVIIALFMIAFLFDPEVKSEMNM